MSAEDDLKAEDLDYWEKPCPRCGENDWAQDWYWGEDSEDEMPVWECDNCGWPSHEYDTSTNGEAGEIVHHIAVRLDDRGITESIDKALQQALVYPAGKELVDLQIKLNKQVRLLSTTFETYTKSDLSTIKEEKIIAVLVKEVHCRWTTSPVHSSEAESIHAFEDVNESMVVHITDDGKGENDLIEIMSDTLIERVGGNIIQKQIETNDRIGFKLNLTVNRLADIDETALIQNSHDKIIVLKGEMCRQVKNKGTYK